VPPFSDKNGKNGKLPRFGKNIQYFLDRLYTSRISLRMLINQHTLLFSDRVSSCVI
jgi:pyruvate dehydrogenase kinase 2/3/4